MKKGRQKFLKKVIQKSWSAKFFPVPKLGASSPPMIAWIFCKID